MPNYVILVFMLSYGIVVGILDAFTQRIELRRWTVRSKFDLILVTVLILLGLADALFNRNDPDALKPIPWNGWAVLLVLLVSVYTLVVGVSVYRLQRAWRMRRADEHDNSPTVVALRDEERARR